MTHPFLIEWLLLMIRFEFVYVYFIEKKECWRLLLYE